MGCWGLGGLAGALTGFAQARLLPAGIPAACRWGRDAWRFGRWLAAHEVVYQAGAQANVFVLAALLGPAALGGLRAVQTVFAPLSLLSPALALPGLPLVTRELSVSWARGRTLAFKLGALLVTLTLAYMVVLGAVRTTVLSGLFGNAFVQYAAVVIPVGVQQLFSAFGEGLVVLLQAAGRGRALFWTRALSVPFGLLAIWIGHHFGGLVLVAWGLAASRGLWLGAMLAACAERPGLHFQRRDDV